MHTTQTDSGTTEVDLPPVPTLRRPRSLTQPRVWIFLVLLLGVGLGTWLWYSGHHNALEDWLTLAWSLPLGISILGLLGATKPWPHLASRKSSPVDDELIVVVPTIGRKDTFPGLERVCASLCKWLPACFPNARIDIVIEEGCEMSAEIRALQRPMVRVLTVPAAYETNEGTLYKARAAQYALGVRGAAGEARHDAWVLHMDDDTSVGPGTVNAMADFIINHGDVADLGQGVLTYPRQLALNRWTWFADAVRPADDLTRFRVLTGGGWPLAGLHGELLLVRSSVEADIGWDFGPRAITEDAHFGLRFAHRYPGRSRWFAGRCFGASPGSVGDFVRQRRRWAQGLLSVLVDRGVPIRYRVPMMYMVFAWLTGIFGNVCLMVVLAAVVFGFHMSPIWHPLTVVWAINFAYVVFLYVEGVCANARASGRRRPHLRWLLAVVLFIPLWSVMEGVGAMLGAGRWLRRRDGFEVVAKLT